MGSRSMFDANCGSESRLQRLQRILMTGIPDNPSDAWFLERELRRFRRACGMGPNGSMENLPLSALDDGRMRTWWAAYMDGERERAVSAVYNQWEHARLCKEIQDLRRRQEDWENKMVGMMMQMGLGLGMGGLSTGMGTGGGAWNEVPGWANMNRGRGGDGGFGHGGVGGSGVGAAAGGGRNAGGFGGLAGHGRGRGGGLGGDAGEFSGIEGPGEFGTNRRIPWGPLHTRDDSLRRPPPRNLPQRRIFDLDEEDESGKGNFKTSDRDGGHSGHHEPKSKAEQDRDRRNGARNNVSNRAVDGRYRYRPNARYSSRQRERRMPGWTRDLFGDRSKMHGGEGYRQSTDEDKENKGKRSQRKGSEEMKDPRTRFGKTSQRTRANAGREFEDNDSGEPDEAPRSRRTQGKGKEREQHSGDDNAIWESEDEPDSYERRREQRWHHRRRGSGGRLSLLDDSPRSSSTRFYGSS